MNSDDGAVAAGDIGILKTSCVSYDRFNPYESKPVVKDELQSVKCAVEKDSVIVSRMNTPERVGACGYVSTDFPNLFLPDRLWKLKFQDNVDAYFVYMMLVSSVYKEKITSMASGTSGSMYNIPKETFLNLQLVVPVQTSEQRKIGQVLRQLNDLITLHQRKYDKLQVLKKAMLEKMFPKNGSSVPEIRFKGFTDAWEQRKVGDLLIERNQQAPMSDEYPLMAFIANEGVAPKGERYDRSALVTDTVNKLYKKTEKGDFIYSSNNLETGSIGLNKYGKACISPVYSIFEPTGIADSDFLGRRLVRKDFINAMVKWRQGVIYGQWRIHESDFLKIEITVPSVEEQRKIGTYLDQLDNLITLHQRELEKLQNIKKSMLEKMFV